MKKFSGKKLSAAGGAAGFINGFLGSGGGILILSGLLKTGVEQKKAHASAVFAIAPLSVISAFFYSGDIPVFGEVWQLFAGCAAGGAAGAFFLRKISSRVLELVFDGLIIYSGVRMLLP